MDNKEPFFSRLKGYFGNKFIEYTEKFPKRYSLIYFLYTRAKGNLYNFSNFSSRLFLILMLLCSYLFYKWDDKDLMGILLIIVPYVMTGISVFLLGYVIQFRLQNTGVLKEFRYLGTRLIRKPISEGFDLNIEGIDASLYEFVTETTINIAADLNARAYQGGQWGTSFEDKKTRNLSHVKRNSLSIMLFRFKLGGPFVGFTHIFPVTRNVWDDYTNGNIRDIDYSAANIVSDNPENIDEYPYGLILFSVGCPELNDDVYTPARENEYKYYLGEFIEKAQVYHINELLKKHFTIDPRYRRSTVSALLQNEDLGYKKFYYGYADTSKKSADDCTIIQFKIKNHNA